MSCSLILVFPFWAFTICWIVCFLSVFVLGGQFSIQVDYLSSCAKLQTCSYSSFVSSVWTTHRKDLGVPLSLLAVPILIICSYPCMPLLCSLPFGFFHLGAGWGRWCKDTKRSTYPLHLFFGFYTHFLHAVERGVTLPLHRLHMPVLVSKTLSTQAVILSFSSHMPHTFVLGGL